MQKIEIENLSFSYGNEKQVLTDINVSVSNQVSLGLIGANGAGKSTLLKLLVGLLSDYRGQININDLLLNKKIYLKYEKRWDMCFKIQTVSFFYQRCMKM